MAERVRLQEVSNQEGTRLLPRRPAADLHLAQRRAIKQLALSRPQDHDLPFCTWSLAKLADFLIAEGVVDDISHEGLRGSVKPPAPRPSPRSR